MSHRKLMCLCIIALIPFAVGACDDPGPVGSGPVTITINSMNASDIREPGTVRKDENISMGTGNPWGEFVKRGRAECDGDPVAFDVTSVQIALDEGSDVARFEDVIDGVATVFFADNSGSDEDATAVDVAFLDQPTGPDPVTLTVIATRSSLTPLLNRLVGGDFHVGLRAATSMTDDDSFSMDVKVTFTARAYCD